MKKRPYDFSMGYHFETIEAQRNQPPDIEVFLCYLCNRYRTIEHMRWVDVQSEPVQQTVCDTCLKAMTSGLTRYKEKQSLKKLTPEQKEIRKRELNRLRVERWRERHKKV